MKRIIPVSSGKGGVGKTSFAVNLALSLSRYDKTILIDLDTGTSSIRNVIRASVPKDLYHFFNRKEPLANCIQSLPDRLNPNGCFDNFGFIASPKHYIDAIANMNQHAREKLIDGINGLDAKYIILDLKAGLDPAVVDFMPYANTGILIFTPNHPAATLAASDIVKAILFRGLREFFHRDSILYRHFRDIDPDEINHLIDITEDPYRKRLPNVDAFLYEMNMRYPNHSFVRILHHIVQRFQVYYILNRFDGVDNSYQTAVKPLIKNIYNNISAKVDINNLGWIIESEAYNEANAKRCPYLIGQEIKKSEPEDSPELDATMAELYALAGIKPRKKKTITQTVDTKDILDDQLMALKAMYQTKQEEPVEKNFEYIVSCIRYMDSSKRLNDFGTSRLLKNGELLTMLMNRKMRKVDPKL